MDPAHDFSANPANTPMVVNSRTFPMGLSAYVSFKGDCEAAFKFYEESLGGKPGLLFRYGDSPMADAVPEG